MKKIIFAIRTSIVLVIAMTLLFNLAVSVKNAEAADTDLQINKTIINANPVPGGFIDFSISYQNIGTVPKYVEIVDTLPPGLSHDSAWWTEAPWVGEPVADPSTIGNQLVWDMPQAVPAEGQYIFTERMRIDEFADPNPNIQNCAAIMSDSEDPNPIESCVEFTVLPSLDNDELEVSKTATTYYTRTYSWDINKDVSPTSHTGFAGDSFASGYTVSVGQTIIESDFIVTGTIRVTNLTAGDKTVTITDSAGGENATLSCGGSLFVPDSGSAECDYSIDLPSRTDGVNTATVSYNGIDYSGVAPYAFGEPTTIIGYDSINVTDTNGSSWQANGYATWTYVKDFQCPTDLSAYVNGIYNYTVDNTATIVENGYSDSASVNLTCYAPASARVVKTTTEGPENIGQFPFVFELIHPNGTIVETQTLNSSGTVTFNTVLTTEGTWEIEELQDGWISTPQECTFDISYPTSAGITTTCSFHNTEMSRVELFKLTDGNESPTIEWTFSLNEGTTSLTADSTPPALLNFGNENLNSTKNYTICEESIPAGWSAYWEIDTDGDDIVDTAIIPYNPDLDGDPPQDLGNRCFDFGDNTNYPLTPGDKLVFEVDNSSPGGDPRSPGYWKNWNNCTAGNQADTAAKNGGPDEGWFILDDILNDPGISWGVFDILTCEDGVSILDQRDLNSGKKRASDAAYTLAMHLLAAQLNLAVGAKSCPAVMDVVLEAETLLESLGFDGTGRYLRPKDALYDDALVLADILDAYNNGLLCVDVYSINQNIGFLDTSSNKTREPHESAEAQAGNCTSCHGDIVDNMDDGHYIPTYTPSLVTPWPSGKDLSGPNGEGNCVFCHFASVYESDDGPVLIMDNAANHHNTGFYDEEGTKCGWCHDVYTVDPPSISITEYSIRRCQGCHGPDSLHDIQADSNGDGVIVVGGELAGYGHVGRDAGPGDSDCWGCHGFEN